MIKTPEKQINDQPQTIGLDLDETLNKNKKVLIVDDDPDTVELMKRIIRLSNFNVASAKNGSEALFIAEKIQPDIILLDLMMPEIDGKETLIQLQKVSSAPVIVVSALSGKKNIIELLNLGCDDYLSKPFDREELIARINAVLRRTRLLSVIDGVSIPEIGLMVNFSRREVHFQGNLIHFSPKEYELVEVCIKNIPHIVNYHEISEVLWGESDSDSKNRIKYLVHAIRKKFREIDSTVEVIINANRIGYRIQSD